MLLQKLESSEQIIVLKCFEFPSLEFRNTVISCHEYDVKRMLWYYVHVNQNIADQ